MLFTGDHVVDRARGHWTDLARVAGACGLRVAHGRDRIRFVNGCDAWRKRRGNRAGEHVSVADCAGRADKGKTDYRHDHGQAVRAHAQDFTILMLLLNRVMRNFTILILLLSGREIVIDVTRLVVGAMIVALRCWLILIQIDGKLERGRKLRDSSWPSEAVSSRRRLSAGALPS